MRRRLCGPGVLADWARSGLGVVEGGLQHSGRCRLRTQPSWVVATRRWSGEDLMGGRNMDVL